MDDLVNTLNRIRKEILGSGLTPEVQGECFFLAGPGSGKTASILRIFRLYRASSEDVERAAAPDALLVLTAPTQKAIKAAAQHNHIILPDGGYRIVAPGVALFKEGSVQTRQEPRKVKLRGLTGVVAETLLLERMRVWSVRGLAEASGVSLTLAHRVLTRLDAEGLTSSLRGDRRLSNPRALAELWSQEEGEPELLLNGYLFGSSTEAVARKLLDAEPDSAVGGTLAANAYQPVLTRVNPPVRLWVTNSTDPAALQSLGFESTTSGANVEVVRSKGDPWRVKMNKEGLRRVSPWRAWVEIANVGGRTQELADELIEKLLKKD
jgi:hypothetical protein